MNNFLIAKFPKWTISQIYNVAPSVIFPNRQYPNVAFKNGMFFYNEKLKIPSISPTQAIISRVLQYGTGLAAVNFLKM